MVDAQGPAAPDLAERRQRGFLLTTLLTILTIGACVSAYLAVRETLDLNPDVPAWAVWSKTLLSIVNVTMLGAVWGWKRWGFVGLGCTSAVLYIINGIIGFGWDISATGFIPVILLFLLVWYRKLWSSFR